MCDSADPSILQAPSAFLPPDVQHLLDSINSQCHIACSDVLEYANAITGQLHNYLQQLVAAILIELDVNPENILGSGNSWHLLGRLVNDINHHFQIRPRIMFASDDAGMQSAASAARGIRECFTRFVELLSTDEDRADNTEAFKILLMETDGDAEISMRLAFLDIISRRVVAVKRPDQRWHVTIDGDACAVPLGDFSSGFDEVPTPLRDDDLDEVTCNVCQDAMYHKENDGNIVLLARQLKCHAVVDVSDSSPRGHAYPHVFHESCAQRWFVEQKGTSCPICRHNFSEHIFDDVAAALEHEVVENGRHVQWTNTTNRRVAALNTILHLSRESPPGSSIVHALVWSLADEDQSTILAAARAISHLSAELGSLLGPELHRLLCQHLSTFLKSRSRTYCFHLSESDVIIARAICRLLFETLSHALTCFENDDAIVEISNAIRGLAKDIDSSHINDGFFQSSGCEALVQALTSVSSDGAKAQIATAISQLSIVGNIWYHFDLADAGACEAVVHALTSAVSDDAKAGLATAIGQLSRHGLSDLIASGACEAVVDALRSSTTDAAKATISEGICNLVYHNFYGQEEIITKSRDAFIAAGAFVTVADALRSVVCIDSKARISSVILYLAKDDACRLVFITLGVCDSLVVALSSASTENTKADFLRAIAELASHHDGRIALLEADVCKAAVGALESTPCDNLSLEIYFAFAISFLAADEDGCRALAACGAFNAVVQVLRSAEGDDYATENISSSIIRIALKDDDSCNHGGCLALVAAGACEALVQLLRSAANDSDSKRCISRSIKCISRNHDGCHAFVEAGACEALIQSFNSSRSEYAKASISRAIGQLVRIDIGRHSLVSAGAFEFLAEALKLAAGDYEATLNILNSIADLSSYNDNLPALIAAGVCKAVMDVLRSLVSNDDELWAVPSDFCDNHMVAVSCAVQQLARYNDGFCALVAAGAFEALDQSLSLATSESAKAAISSAIRLLARNDDCQRASDAASDLIYE